MCHSPPRVKCVPSVCPWVWASCAHSWRKTVHQCHVNQLHRTPQISQTIDPDIIPKSTTEQYFPNCSNLLYQLILYQSKCLWNTKLSKDHRCHRWNKDLISFAASVYISSPRTYRLISWVLSLPSESLIKRNKNNFDKEPGINHNFIQWMHM